MCDKFEAEDLSEGRHLRGHHRIRSAARGHHHIAVVDHATMGASIRKAQCLTQKGLGLEAGEARVVLDEVTPGIGEHQGGTLGLDGVIAQLEVMW